MPPCTPISLAVKEWSEPQNRVTAEFIMKIGTPSRPEWGAFRTAVGHSHKVRPSQAMRQYVPLIQHQEIGKAPSPPSTPEIVFTDRRQAQHSSEVLDPIHKHQVSGGKLRQAGGAWLWPNFRF